LISLTTFLLVYMLNDITMQLGFAIGLFAIFGIIRYRTIVIPIKEMTYLFVLIGISIINGLTNIEENWEELFLANGLFVFFCWLFESRIFKTRVSTKLVMYDDIKLVRAGREAELKQDLEERLGLKIIKIEIERIDLSRDCVSLIVSHVAQPDE
jgi:hypothetical protein